MRGTASKLFVCVVFAGLCPPIFAGQGHAAQCGDIYPDARIGPPPEWSFWGDGSACFVKWDIKDDAQDLTDRCQKTPSARFVHFEHNVDEGQGICIFKLLGSEPPSQEQALKSSTGTPARLAATEHENGQRPTQYRKSDAENPSLNEVERVVTQWTEKCLKAEKTEALAVAGECWRNAANAIDVFSGEHGFLTVDLQDQIQQLRTAWVQRSEQLKMPLVRVAHQKPETILPAATHFEGPDPDRLAETATCSSISLGNSKECVREPIATGPNKYAVRLNPRCEEGVAAALKVHDAKGRCIRKVVAILPKSKPTDITSFELPGVLDAISLRDSETFSCYVRRHEQISCDGATDYGVTASANTDSPEIKVKRKKRTQVRKQKEVVAKKRVTQPRKEEVQVEEKPSIIGKISNSLKDLLNSNN